jgi:hypothetical protein
MESTGIDPEFIFARNLHRRHLPKEERALIAAKVMKLRQEEQSNNREKCKIAGPRANLPAGRARDRTAKEYGISPRSVEHASVVLNKGIPELQQALENRDVSVSTAAAIAQLPVEEQRALVSKGPKAVKRKGAELRANRRNAKQLTEETRSPATPELRVDVNTEPVQLARDLIARLGTECARQLCAALTQALAESPTDIKPASSPRCRPQGGRALTTSAANSAADASAC